MNLFGFERNGRYEVSHARGGHQNLWQYTFYSCLELSKGFDQVLSNQQLFFGEPCSKVIFPCRPFGNICSTGNLNIHSSSFLLNFPQDTNIYFKLLNYSVKLFSHWSRLLGWNKQKLLIKICFQQEILRRWTFVCIWS